MACKDCKYMELSDRSGYKCYCTWHRTYYDPDDNECSHFVSDRYRSDAEKDDSTRTGCYITTACMASQMSDFQDDCY